MSVSKCFKRVKKGYIAKIATLLCLGVMAHQSQSSVIKVSSCSLSDVQTALKSAVEGDIISIPAGSATWSGPLSITKKNITLQGSGIGKTIITGSGQLFNLSGQTGNNLRITGVELHSCSACIQANGSGSPKMTVQNFRLDNSKFVKAYLVVQTSGAMTGVIDHCTFVDCYGARLYGSNDPNAKFPLPLGTSDALFFEDNTINVTTSGSPQHFIASNSFSKYVIRHNTFTYAKSLWDIVDAHGYCEVQGRGSATWEIYDNVFNLVPTIDRVIHLRGGQGVVFGNTFNNYKPKLPISLTDYSYCNPPCVAGCSGYPCKDQINRSYFWGNTIAGSAVNPTNDCSSILKVDRDYYNQPMPDYKPYAYPHPLTLQDYPAAVKMQKLANVSSDEALNVVPKPFSQLTAISYNLKTGGMVKIAIYNAGGALVKNLVNETQSAGSHSITWNAANAPKGLYVIKADIGSYHNSVRLVR